MTTYTFPIEKGHVISFARSLGDENPIYFDEVYATNTEFGTPIAPPTFTQAALRFAPSNPFRLGRDRDGGDAAQGKSVTSGLTSGGGTQLHAEQHFEYFRPVRVGETLSVVERVGSTWQKEGRRGGRLSFTETCTDFIDVGGKIVISVRTVSVQTSRVVGES
jgi:acyl dehydratase